jgi:acyl-CoA thioesterase
MADLGIAAATQLEELGHGRFGAVVPGGWSVSAGVNGGIVSAILARAALDEVSDPQRPLRSFSAHFLRPVQPGPAELEVTREREGRTLTTLTVGMSQEGRTVALALVACGAARAQTLFDTAQAPQVPPAQEVPAIGGDPSQAPEVFSRFEFRPVFGPGLPGLPGEPDDGVALAGGWIEPREKGPLDAPTACALLDAWWPAGFAALGEPAALPTVDLTVHIRRPLPNAATGPVLVRFKSRLLTDGYVEEDGELWSADGLLLAQSRQLAVHVTERAPAKGLG